jgi:hypothetical protein
MTTVLNPFIASPEPIAALVVVLPTPPFPEVMTTIFARFSSFLGAFFAGFSFSEVTSGDAFLC